MLHLDAKAVRERLNSVMLAISALEQCPPYPEHRAIARAALQALREISVLVTDDELEEHGEQPTGQARAARQQIRSAEKDGTGADSK
ncbi:MAG: hypothetical protein ACRD01_05435 [Terriglobales bacterium]